MFHFPQNEDWNTQLDALKSFLALWYKESINAAKISSNKQAETFKGLLPAPLIGLHEFIGQNRSAFFPQNRLLPTTEIDLDTQEPVFYIENQGVYLWAFQKGSDNPPVMGKFIGHTQGWQVEEESLTAFLYQICIFEAIVGAPYGASVSSCTEEDLTEILAHWELIPYSAWRWPAYPTSFYIAGEALMVVSPNDSNYSIFCGAKEKADLQFMKSFTNSNWEYCNFID
jgi:hypothetical protein